MNGSLEDHTIYEITIEGQLDERWSEWFDGLAVMSPTATTTTLRGMLPDQAALFGVLKKIHNLSLPLISVRRIATQGGGASKDE
jgi:hypothetical protein